MFRLTKVIRTLSLFASVFILSGCAALTHYNFKRSDIGGVGDAVFVDAKQRAVLSAQQPYQTVAMLQGLRDDAMVKANQASTAASVAMEEHNDEDLRDAWLKERKYYRKYADQIGEMIIRGNFAHTDLSMVAMCAEPSPDALSALAASGGLAAEVFGQGKGQIQAALAESAGSIGLRTQSIQLMRDAMYRLCEGSMNAALGNAAFETLHRRFQNSMVAILAIEQLTGAVQAQALALGSQSATGAATELAGITEQMVTTRTSLRKAEEETAEAKKKADDKKKERDEKQAELDTAKDKLARDDACIAGQKAATADKPFTCDPPKLEQKPREDLEKEMKTKTGEVEVLTSDHAKLDQTAKDKQKNVDDLKANLEALEQAADALRIGRSTALANAEISPATRIANSALTAPGEIGITVDSDKPVVLRTGIGTVALAVENIVQSYYDESYIDEVCTTLFTSIIDGEVSASEAGIYLSEFQFSLGQLDGGSDVPEVTHILEVCQENIAKDAKRRSSLADERLRLVASRVADLDARQERVDRRANEIQQAEEENRTAQDQIRRQQQEIRRTNDVIVQQKAQIETSKEEFYVVVANTLEELEAALGVISDVEKLVELVDAVCTLDEPSMFQPLTRSIAKLTTNESKRALQCQELAKEVARLNAASEASTVKDRSIRFESLKNKLATLIDEYRREIEKNIGDSSG